MIGGSIIALQLALEFYDSYVTNGMSWDDALQNVGTSAIGIAGATAASIGAETIAISVFGVAAGPAGWIAIGIGVIVSVAYDVILKDWVHTKLEEGEDWWEQQKW